jgi:hypothetical protein
MLHFERQAPAIKAEVMEIAVRQATSFAKATARQGALAPYNQEIANTLGISCNSLSRKASLQACDSSFVQL